MRCNQSTSTSSEPSRGKNNHSIEVVAMFGDSVIGVKHCSNANEGRVRPITWAMLVAGCALIVCATGAFAKGVQTAKRNYDAFHNHVFVEGRAAYKFRETRLSHAYDWIALGGFGVGIALIGFGAVRMRTERMSPDYRVGRDPKADCAADLSIPQTKHPFALVSRSNGTYFVNVDDTMVAKTIDESGNTKPLTTAITEVPQRGRIHVSLGPLGFFISRATQPPRLFPRIAIDRRVVRSIGSAAAALAIILVFSWSIPPQANSLAFDMDNDREPRLMLIENLANETDIPRPAAGTGGTDSGTAKTNMAVGKPGSGGPGRDEPRKKNSSKSPQRPNHPIEQHPLCAHNRNRRPVKRPRKPYARRAGTS